MYFSQFKTARLAEMMTQPWGDLRIPDLLELLAVAKPKRVLEIGSYAGVSTEIFALHCQRVVTIDPSPDLRVRRRLHAAVAHYPHVEIIEGLSLEKMPTINEKFDLIYLDGDHSYDTVKAEIKLAPSFFEPCGGRWLAGHDYTPLDDITPGVKMAVDEMLGVPPYRFSDSSWLCWKDVSHA